MTAKHGNPGFLQFPARLRLPAYLAAFLLPALVLGLVILQPWFEARWMFMDVLTAARESPDCCHATYGMMSQAGLLLWSATAATALFGAFLLRVQAAPTSHQALLLYAGLLTGWLLLDDAYLLHESILPGLGVPQILIQLAYAAAALVYLWLNRTLIRQAEWPILLAAGASMAASIGLDLVVESRSDAAVIIEDALKFYGFVLWTVFHITTCAGLVLANADQAAEDTPGT